MEIYNVITIIIVLAAIFGYINHRFIKLPGTIGIMLISLIASLGVVGIGIISPTFFERTTRAISFIDFQTLLLKVMLSFLLFAAAIHIDSKKLKSERISIITFSTIGVVISTFVIGTLLHLHHFTLWLIGQLSLLPFIRSINITNRSDSSCGNFKESKNTYIA